MWCVLRRRLSDLGRETVLHSYLSVSRVCPRGRVAIGSPRAWYVDGWRAPRIETRGPGLSSAMSSTRGAPTSPSTSSRPARKLRSGPFVTAPLFSASATTSPLTVFTVLAFWPTGQPAHGHRGCLGSHRSKTRSLMVTPGAVGSHPESPWGSKEGQLWEELLHPSSWASIACLTCPYVTGQAEASATHCWLN